MKTSTHNRSRRTTFCQCVCQNHFEINSWLLDVEFREFPYHGHKAPVGCPGALRWPETPLRSQREGGVCGSGRMGLWEHEYHRLSNSTKNVPQVSEYPFPGHLCISFNQLPVFPDNCSSGLRTCYWPTSRRYSLRRERHRNWNTRWSPKGTCFNSWALVPKPPQLMVKHRQLPRIQRAGPDSTTSWNNARNWSLASASRHCSHRERQRLMVLSWIQSAWVYHV